jgi:hypothetical protein
MTRIVMRTIPICFLAVLFNFSLLAQQAAKGAPPAKPAVASSPSADVPSKEQLIRLFDVMEIQKQMSSMVKAFGDNMEKMLPGGMSELSPKQKAGMAALNSELFGKAMSPEFVDNYVGEMIPIYQQHFTKSEVDDLISFYASHVGQKFLHEQPVLMQESFAKVIPLTQKRMQSVMEEINYEQRLKEVFNQEEQPATPPKK